MNASLDKFLITNHLFYINTANHLSYASKLGVSKVYLRDLNLCLDILESFGESCKKLNILLFINYLKDFLSHSLVRGVHLKSDELDYKPNIPQNLLTSYSAHNLNDIEKAYNAGIDYIFLSPIFFVEHKMPPLGLEYISKIPQIYKKRLYALGGINHSNISHFVSLGVKGVAGIRMFLKEEK